MTVISKLMPHILAAKDEALSSMIVNDDIRECMRIDIIDVGLKVTACFIYESEDRGLKMTLVSLDLAPWEPYDMYKLRHFFAEGLHALVEEDRHLTKVRAENIQLFSKVKSVLQFFTVIAIATGVYLTLG